MIVKIVLACYGLDHSPIPYSPVMNWGCSKFWRLPPERRLILEDAACFRGHDQSHMVLNMWDLEDQDDF